MSPALGQDEATAGFYERDVTAAVLEAVIRCLELGLNPDILTEGRFSLGATYSIEKTLSLQRSRPSDCTLCLSEQLSNCDGLGSLGYVLPSSRSS